MAHLSQPDEGCTTKGTVWQGAAGAEGAGAAKQSSADSVGDGDGNGDGEYGGDDGGYLALMRAVQATCALY